MKTFSGITGQEGEMKFHDFPGMKRMFLQHPNTRFYLHFELFETKASELILGYYFKKIVPDFQQAFKDKLGERLTLEATDEALRSFYPGAKVEVFTNKGYETTRIKEAREFTNKEMTDFIDHIKMLAAQEFDLFISDPETL